MKTYKVGDKVRTRFKLRGMRRHGVVERIDGWYYYVRLKQGHSIIELYANEIEHANSRDR